MSASLAAVPLTVCTRPEATSTPICAFIPKCHWLPFLVWCISGSRLFCLFLVEGGAAMMVASTIVPPAFAGAGFGASISRAPPASPILRRTMLGSTRAAPANGGNSGLSSPPELPLPPDRYRQSRARLGCHRAHPPSPRRPAHTTAAGSGSAASAPDQSAVGRARPSDRKVADAPPAAPTGRPAPSRPKTCRAASASSCRRIPPAKSFPEAASPGPSVPAPADSTLSGPQPGYFFGVSLDQKAAPTETLAAHHTESAERIEQQAATIDVLKMMPSTPG